MPASTDPAHRPQNPENPPEFLETESQFPQSGPSMTGTPLTPTLPLCQLPAHATGRVRELKGDAAFCQRVREMGFGESTYVTKVSGQRTILCQVNGTRIALSHDAARQILVERVGGR